MASEIPESLKKLLGRRIVRIRQIQEGELGPLKKITDSYGLELDNGSFVFPASVPKEFDAVLVSITSGDMLTMLDKETLKKEKFTYKPSRRRLE